MLCHCCPFLVAVGSGGQFSVMENSLFFLLGFQNLYKLMKLRWFKVFCSWEDGVNGHMAHFQQHKNNA